jgi:GAF domain-containing protein
MPIVPDSSENLASIAVSQTVAASRFPVESATFHALSLTAFDEVFRALTRDARPEEMFLLLADKARVVTDCASAAMALLDTDPRSLTFVAVAGRESAEILGSRVHLTGTVVGHTARSGEPYLAFRPFRPGEGSGDESVLSVAVVPIFGDGRSIGALAALNKTGGGPFGGDDLMALSTLAAAAGVALRDSRLKEDSDRQGRELSLLYEAVRNVSGKLSTQEVLRSVVEQTAALLEHSAVVVFLANDERTHLYIAEATGLEAAHDLREVTLPTDSGLGAAALGATSPIALRLTDEDQAAGAPPAAGLRTADGVLWVESPFPSVRARSGLAAPIRSADAAHGLVLVLTGQPLGTHSPADAKLLSALASQAAVAMENSWLYEDATRRAEEATALYELSQAVTSTLRLPQVLDRVANSVMTLLGVDKFAIFLHDPVADRLEMVVERGLPEGAADRVRPTSGQGIPGWVMEFETPTAVQDVAADHRNASAPLHPEGVASMTCMPLQVGSSTIGVLCAMSSRRRRFTVGEMELLYTIANQAAIAIENARMYADVRHKSLELRKSFQRVARALGSSQFPGALPELIASLTLDMTQADRCAVFSVEQDEPRAAPRLRMQASVGFRVVAPGPAAGGETPTAWVARKGRSLAIDDLEQHARFGPTAPRPSRGRLGAYLAVPLRAGNRDVVGVLEVYTRTPRRWRADEVRLLIAFAAQAAVAFQNGRLVDAGARASRRADALAALLDIALASDTPTVDAVLSALRSGIDPAPFLIVLRRSDGVGPWLPLVLEGANDADVEAARQAAAVERGGDPAVTKSGIGVTSSDGATFLWMGTATDAAQPNVQRRSETVSILRAAVEILARMVGEAKGDEPGAQTQCDTNELLT